MKRVYYAHCKSIYDTPQEQRDIDTLEELDFAVVNPNEDYHFEQCRKNGDANVMKYFYELIDKCDAVAFRALSTMEIPAGVYKEVRYALDTGKTVIELPSRIMFRGLNVEQTRDYLKECGQR